MGEGAPGARCVAREGEAGSPIQGAPVAACFLCVQATWVMVPRVPLSSVCSLLISLLNSSGSRMS